MTNTNFQFTLSHEKYLEVMNAEDIGNTLYTAKLVDGQFHVTWEDDEDGEIGTYYTIEQARECVEDGWWIVK